MSGFDKVLLKKIIEGLLLASNEPLSVKRISEVFTDQEIFGDAVVPDQDEIQAAIEDIQADCLDHGYELKEVASGWRYQVRQEMALWVGRLWEEKPPRYSRAILETMALIAYRQPITRGDIEDIRGVAVSTAIIKTLMERQWVRIVGYRDVPGRPALYATTRLFLDYFNLKNLEELPSLGEVRDLDKINAELDFDQERQLVEALSPHATELAEADVSLENAEESIVPEMIGHEVEPSDISDNDVPDASVLH
jgi:segregation and condensation protein B